MGCILLPGGDAPERVIFATLRGENYRNIVDAKSGTMFQWFLIACNAAMTLVDHHDWVRVAANQLMCGGDSLWAAMCAEWAEITPRAQLDYVLEGISDALATAPNA